MTPQDTAQLAPDPDGLALLYEQPAVDPGLIRSAVARLPQPEAAEVERLLRQHAAAVKETARLNLLVVTDWQAAVTAECEMLRSQVDNMKRALAAADQRERDLDREYRAQVDELQGKLHAVKERCRTYHAAWAAAEGRCASDRHAIASLKSEMARLRAGEL